jgi:hypothetical protein
MPISLVGFVEAQSQSYLFVSSWWLISMESSEKSKQTPPLRL